MDAERDLKYGDRGAPVDREAMPCRECWEDHMVWYGNAWGFRHRDPGLHKCEHECHLSEVYFA